MEINLETLNDTRKKATVKVGADEVGQQERELVSEFKQQARLPGFRPGKAPEDMVRKRYRKDIEEQLTRRLTQKAYDEVAKDESVRLYSVVNVENDGIKPDAAATINFTVDVRPEVPLPKYKGLEVTVPPTEVTGEEVQRTLDHILNQRAEYKTVERPAATGDYVKVSYEGRADGQPVAELAPDHPIYGKQPATWEEAGATEAPGVQAVIQGIVGMAAGDHKTVEEPFPNDHEVEALRGKTASYEVEVQEVREKILPELDEHFFKSLQVADEAELRQRIKDDLESQNKQNSSQAKRQQIIDQLQNQVDIPVPESAVEQERENILREYMGRAMQQGATQEQLEERQEELVEGAGQAAVQRVKLQLILSRIAEEEAIKVENEDMQQRIMQQAMAQRRKPDEIVKELQNDRGQLLELQRAVLFGKTLDFVSNEASETIGEPEGAQAG